MEMKFSRVLCCRNDQSLFRENFGNDREGTMERNIVKVLPSASADEEMQLEHFANGYVNQHDRMAVVAVWLSIAQNDVISICIQYLSDVCSVAL